MRSATVQVVAATGTLPVSSAARVSGTVQIVAATVTHPVPSDLVLVRLWDTRSDTPKILKKSVTTQPLCPYSANDVVHYWESVG